MQMPHGTAFKRWRVLSLESLSVPSLCSSVSTGQFIGQHPPDTGMPTSWFGFFFFYVSFHRMWQLPYVELNCTEFLPVSFFPAVTSRTPDFSSWNGYLVCAQWLSLVSSEKTRLALSTDPFSHTSLFLFPSCHSEEILTFSECKFLVENKDVSVGLL